LLQVLFCRLGILPDHLAAGGFDDFPGRLTTWQGRIVSDLPTRAGNVTTACCHLGAGIPNGFAGIRACRQLSQISMAAN
jgi:hypothetical protein